jgi:hypothetical protein
VVWCRRGLGAAIAYAGCSFFCWFGSVPWQVFGIRSFWCREARASGAGSMRLSAESFLFMVEFRGEV